MKDWCKGVPNLLIVRTEMVIAQQCLSAVVMGLVSKEVARQDRLR